MDRLLRLIFLILMMASMSGAHAETYYQRDRDGRIIGHDEVVNDDRINHFDKGGRMIGYSQRVDGRWYQHDKDGRITGQSGR
jgi:hypothetical protein